MRSKEDFDKIIRLYQTFMVEPLVYNKTYIFLDGAYNGLEYDDYDKIEVIHSYDPTHYSVRFGVVRKRPDRYMINKMYCVLADVQMFDIERWYDEYSRLIEKSKDWKWEY